MSSQSIQQAVALFIDARRSGQLLDGLPASCQPKTLDDAHAIQDATAAALGDTIAGWKVGAPIDGQVVRGVLLRSRMLTSPARISAAQVPLQGVEAEIAFRFDRDLPARGRDYDCAEVADAVTAMAAIEIVDSRLRGYPDVPMLDRIADCVSNGAFVQGTLQSRWRDIDLATLRVELTIDERSIVQRVGGHPAGDPLLPALALVNDLRRRDGVRAGQIMTTGTYTGMNYAKPGETVTASFENFGLAQVLFVD